MRQVQLERESDTASGGARHSQQRSKEKLEKARREVAARSPRASSRCSTDILLKPVMSWESRWVLDLSGSVFKKGMFQV